MKPLKLPAAGKSSQTACPELIALQNPDGSLSVGLPPGAALPLPPPSPRESYAALREHALSVDLDRTFHRHEQCFAALLLSELIIEFMFSLLLLSVAKRSVEEVSQLYTNIPLRTLWSIFWGLFVCEVSYIKIYYGLGFVAVVRSKPRVYNWFTNVAIVGIVVQVLFAYMNGFNLMIFLMRLASFVYAKFMRIQLERASLLPAVP
mmetsp:Transcript_123894/g.361829  ORF Transcript_123894/g.361829 Transcript_123894/m.361829 type:complete len:205 (+) Transcript_123894:87-701(+)